MTGKLNNARNTSTVTKNQSNPQKIYLQCQRKQCLKDIQSETQQSTTNYYAKNEGQLTVSDDQLSVISYWRWKSVAFIPSHSHQVTPIPIPIPMKLA